RRSQRSTPFPYTTLFRSESRRDDPDLAPLEPLLAPDDDLGEELAEEYLISATSGENAAEEFRDQETPEERGGPFVETTAAQDIRSEEHTSELQSLTNLVC